MFEKKTKSNFFPKRFCFEPYHDFENCFAEPVTFSDVQAAFETLDQAQDKRITKKKFVKLFPELGVSGDANDIFKALDRSKYIFHSF